MDEFHRIVAEEPIKLSGFNNLSKSLNFCFFGFAVGDTAEDVAAQARRMVHQYGAPVLMRHLHAACEIIDAEVLASSHQEYEPWGSSAMVLLSDVKGHDKSIAAITQGSTVTMHLDKSHMSAHSYPDADLQRGIASLRVDVSIATCGEISPLKSIDALIQQLPSDLVVVDYMVRGFTRSDCGQRIYCDHPIPEIGTFLSREAVNDFVVHERVTGVPNTWHWTLRKASLRSVSSAPVRAIQGAYAESTAAIEAEIDAILNLQAR